VNRRSFLKTGATAIGGVSVAPWLRGANAATPSNEDLLAQANAHIDQHRRADLVLRVLDRDGLPAAGAKVRVTQRQHEFLFGCNLFRWGRVGDPTLEDLYRRRFAVLFNFATLGFYWSHYERERGHPLYDYTDRVAAWCRSQNIRCKGHPLVWDFTPDPPWLPSDFDQIRQLSHERVRAIVSRFRGRIDVWDVVNEPTDMGRTRTRLGAWAKSLGPVPFAAEHLKIARAAHPDALLLVNDYRLDPAFHQILDRLRQEDRLLFDAVGIQSHQHDGPWPLARIGEVCDRFATLGLPLHFTETTLVSGPCDPSQPGRWQPTTPELEARQADAVAAFYTMVFAQPTVAALTWWDFSDRGAWQGAAAGFVRADMTPKPAYDRLLHLIRHRWWTQAEGTTDGAGELRVRPFFGTHQVSAVLPNGETLLRELVWRRDTAKHLDLRVG